jgi:hypothetical protein
MLKNLFSKVFLGLLFIIILFSLAVITTPKVVAKGVEFATCEIPANEIKWWNIISPGAFLPIIPESCGVQGGKISILTPALIPEILFRLYGFFVSLLFMLILPVFTFAGVQWSWAGIFGSAQVESAKALLKNSALGLLVVSLFYGGVMIILSFFGGTEILTTDLSSFFSF